MKLFDLHCDTIMLCYQEQQPLLENSLHISLRAGSGFDSWCQTFAIWIPEEHRDAAAWEYYKSNLACFQKELEANRERIALCGSGAQLRETLEAGQCAAILAIENGSVLGGELSRLEELYQDGVRMITLTWNGVNEIGCGAFSGETAGLTAFGKELLREMAGLGMVADVSHLNRAGFFDVAQSEVPMVASHSNAAAVWAHPRSLENDQIQVLIERNSPMGLNFYQGFLGEEEASGREAVLRHLLHVLDLGGKDILAIGSDFDGATVHPELNGLKQIEPLYWYLAGQGIEKQTLEHIFFQNAYDFFQKIL